LVEVALDEQSLAFAGGGELAFEAGALPRLGKMARNVPRDEVEAAVDADEFVAGSKLAFEVGLLALAATSEGKEDGLLGLAATFGGEGGRLAGARRYVGGSGVGLLALAAT
jgi:hypothetical protein